MCEDENDRPVLSAQVAPPFALCRRVGTPAALGLLSFSALPRRMRLNPQLAIYSEGAGLTQGDFANNEAVVRRSSLSQHLPSSACRSGSGCYSPGSTDLNSSRTSVAFSPIPEICRANSRCESAARLHAAPLC